MQSKVCKRCSKNKPLGDYHKTKQNLDGHKGTCKSCINSDRAEWRKNNKDKVSKQNKAYREANKEKVAAGKAKCYQAKKDHYDKKSKQWVKDNPEGRSEICRRYYESNKEQILAYLTAYRESNKDICRQRIKSWEVRNSDKVRAKCSRRRAAKINAQPPWLNEDQKSRITDFYKQAKDCEIITGESYHVDHIVPLQGKNICGLHVPWNLQVLPSDINLSKGNKYEANFYG